MMSSRKSIVALSALEESMLKAWSIDTCYPASRKYWTPENPAIGHCAVTALVVHKFYGGKIYRCSHQNHYWNHLTDGTIVDLTKRQYVRPVTICIDSTPDPMALAKQRSAETNERYELLFRRVQAGLARKKTKRR